ncbi:MAG: D-alanyl-D-alanine carboxypeptidase, partial [Anaerococcus sp.]|nr:D-alanyl-D-alanine carboxypeptidase [Anaerococcus sp.]
NENIQAPIKKGDVLGKVYVTYDDESYEVNLVAQNDVAQASTFGKIFRTIGNSVNFMIDLLIAR